MAKVQPHSLVRDKDMGEEEREYSQILSSPATVDCREWLSWRWHQETKMFNKTINCDSSYSQKTIYIYHIIISMIIT